MLILFPILVSAQTGCPNCTLNLPPNLPADTVFIEPMPDGSVGEAYDEDISFRLPTTTDAVAVLDTTVLPGLPLEEISITSITNLPVGLAWETDRANYMLPDTTDGCVRFCGIPQQRGMFLVRVTLTARVFVITQSLTFNMPLYIGGATSTTDGFSMENNRDCGTATVDFFNNIPSHSDGFYDYFWDFGNGTTSTDETPNAQRYEEAGVYPVQYRAIVDTVGYVLNSVTILENEACTDLLGNPDLFLAITNAAGEEIASTEPFEEAELPLTIQLFTPINENETYTISFTDFDRFLEGEDDPCGEFPFTTESEGVAEGDFIFELAIQNNRDTITSVDSVYVFAIPDAPDIFVSPSEEVCAGETVGLKTTTYAENLQWYKEEEIILDAIAPSINVMETSKYQVAYTSEEGCTAFSDFQTVLVNPLPPIPIFSNENNLLQLSDLGILTNNQNLQWYLNNTPIADATTPTWCAETSGIYTLEITDVATACTNSFSTEITHDAAIVNCNLTNVEELEVANLNIYPNPTTGLLYLELDTNGKEKISWSLFDLMGRKQLAQVATDKQQLDLSQLPSGIYWLELRSENAVLTRKVVKQ